MSPRRDSLITKVLLILFFLAVIIYAFFEARAILFGPKILIDSSVAHSSEQYILIQGKAEHIATLLINGNPVAVTEAGEFQQPYLLAAGYNRIRLSAKDKYGTSKEVDLEVLYTPPAATSTTDTAPTPDSTGATSTGATH